MRTKPDTSAGALTRSRPRVPVARSLLTNAAAVLVVGVLAVGTWWGLGGDAWGRAVAVPLIVIVLLGGAVLPLGTLKAWPGELALERRPGALVVPGSRLMAGLLLAVLGLVLVVPLVLLAGYLATGGRPAWVPVLVLCLLLVPPALAALVRVARGRIRRNALELSPEGVRYRSYSGVRGLAWDDVHEVRLIADPGRRLVVGPGGGARALRVPLALLASDGVLLAEVVDFYRRHPASRDELAGSADAALERIRGGRFTA